MLNQNDVIRFNTELRAVPVAVIEVMINQKSRLVRNNLKQMNAAPRLVVNYNCIQFGITIVKILTCVMAFYIKLHKATLLHK